MKANVAAAMIPVAAQYQSEPLVVICRSGEPPMPPKLFFSSHPSSVDLRICYCSLPTHY